jgi:predicted Zn-dependent protease with MMP-like domain
MPSAHPSGRHTGVRGRNPSLGLQVAPQRREVRRTSRAWQAVAVVEMSAVEFEEAVGDALDEVPAELMRLLDNVVFFVEDEPPPDDPDLLGIYDGTPLTQRGDGWAAGALPDRITIFRGPLTRMCEDRDELLDEIAVTVVHEIAHHFGIDDARLHELGWG